MKYSKIIGTGSYLPKKILSNADLEKVVETSNDWIVERTGIERRHVVSGDETASSMAFEASKNALDAAGIDKHDIDLILVATTTGDKILPSTACLLQEHLGLPGVPAFDLGAACAGFVYAMSVADQYIRAGTYKTILVVGTEVLTNVVDWTDRATCILFGDGAGAAIFQASDEQGVLSTHLHADGRYKDILKISSGFPATYDENDPPYVRMKGREVFKFAVNALSEIVDETLSANKIAPEQIDWFIPHQANLRIIKALAKKLNFPMDKVVVNTQDHGNTSAASIPLSLDLAIRDGRVQRGQTILMDAIGGGFTWASALLVY